GGLPAERAARLPDRALLPRRAAGRGTVRVATGAPGAGRARDALPRGPAQPALMALVSGPGEPGGGGADGENGGAARGAGHGQDRVPPFHPGVAAGLGGAGSALGVRG